MQLSIICVNWNSVPYLRECITSIYEHTRELDFEIIVVDNASPQGNVDTLKEEFPAIRIVKSSENLGFSRANNLGFRQSRGDYVLFLNPDTRLVSPAITEMLKHMAAIGDAGILGCKLLNSDLSIQTESIQRFPRILNQVLDIERLRLRWPHCSLWQIGALFDSTSVPVKVEVIPGACQLVRRPVFEAVGLYSEDYFMYAEDIDLNYKMRSRGLSSYYVGTATIIHHGGKSSTQHKVSQWSTKMKFRAMVTLYRKHRGRPYSDLYRATMMAAAAGRLLFLTAVLPFACGNGKMAQVLNASAKWRAVFKCAAGIGA